MKSKIGFKSLVYTLFVINFLICVMMVNIAYTADKTPIKVGAPTPITGSMASDGKDMITGLKMAIGEVNEQGGLLGRPLELIPFDTEELLAETMVAAAEKLVVREKADVVIAGYCGEAGPDTFGKYDVPFLWDEGSDASVEVYTNNRKEYWNIFMTCGTSSNAGRMSFDSLMNMASDAGYKFPNNRVAVIWGGWNWDEMYATHFANRAKEKGWEVPFIVEAQLETKEWGGVLQQIRKVDPSIIFFGIWNPLPISTFRLQFDQNPINALIVHNAATAMPEYSDMMGLKAVGELDWTQHAITDTPKAIAWRERYEKFTNTKYGYNDQALTTYEQLMYWVTAVKEVGTVNDYRKVAKAMETISYDGVAGVYKMNKDHYSPVTNVSPMLFYQFQKGGEKESGYRVPIAYIGPNGYYKPVPGNKFEVPPWIKR
jgi:branched-chain amino acid transport system substrate-binding protein